MITLDFETEGIVGNPTVRPPRPVGLAYKRPGQPGQYLAWGHQGVTNGRVLALATRLLADVAESGEDVIFHNSKFDVAVAEAHMGVKFNPENVHDTLYLIALENPYADKFSLKPSAERILGIAPEEQDKLHDWIVSALRVKPAEAGAYIAQAPVELVSPYAIGDVDRTEALFLHLKDRIPAAPYNRERRLAPIVVEGERRGIRVDTERLGEDCAFYEATLLNVSELVWGALGHQFNIGSGDELADALDKANMVEEWVYTPTGRRSTARDNLLDVIKDPLIAKLLAYHGALSHCLSNFYRPWIQLAANSPSGRRMHPEWNQVRQMRGESNDTKGTRTGRLSCTNPNFQNPPNEYELEIPAGLPALPFMRKYLLPEEGCFWCKRDYSQQELRILAHYTEGRLYRAYLRDPRIDAHETCQKLIHDITGKLLIRKHVKITGFSMIYGSGVNKLAEQLGVSGEEAFSIKSAYLQAMPEVGELMHTCQMRGRTGRTIKTWGGREYPVEPPKMIKGRMVHFDYKLLNYLIQGSGADCTKEAIIRWYGDRGSGQFLCTVHDEINISGYNPRDMAKLKEAMESVEFDVPMLSDGFVGPSWYDLTQEGR